LGLGWGRGWRRRNWYHATGLPWWARFGAALGWGAPPAYGPPAAPPTREQEIGVLKTQAGWLKEQLEAIGRRIVELEQEE